MRSIPVLGLLVILLSYPGTSNGSGAAPGLSASDVNTPRSPALSATGEPVLKRASRVMNARVKSPDGKTLGHIHDLVLAPDLNGISYVAVSTGGLLGIGSTLHAVPWSCAEPGCQ